MNLLPLEGGWRGYPPARLALHMIIAIVVLCLLAGTAAAHAVAAGDKGYIQEITGVNLIPFVYLGAKHMVTGYDHLLFLFGVIFFLYRLKHGPVANFCG